MTVIAIRRKDLAKLTILLVIGYLLFLSVIQLELTRLGFAPAAEGAAKTLHNNQSELLTTLHNKQSDLLIIQREVKVLGDLRIASTRIPSEELKLSSKFQIINPKPETVVSEIHMNFANFLQKHYIYSAYIDTRDNKPTIRFIVVVNKRMPKIGWCYFKSPIDNSFSDLKLSSKLTFYETCEAHGLSHVAYILSCEVPPSVLPIINYMDTVLVNDKKLVIPQQLRNATEVSLINTNPAVIRDNNRNRTFGVCVPPLFGDIPVYKLIEFIELTRLLGAEHFVFYNYTIKQPIEKVLRYYEKMGVVTVLPWKLPVESDVWYIGQSVAIGDCLLRTMYHFDWVSFNDLDEFIISTDRSEMTWNTLMTTLESKSRCDVTSDKVATYSFKSAYFDIPENKLTNTTLKWLITQNTTKRTDTFSEVLTKQFVKPERVFEKGIHHLSKQFREEYGNCLVDEKIAFLHHYAKCKNQWGVSCRKYVPDESALRYKEALENNVRDVVNRVTSS